MKIESTRPQKSSSSLSPFSIFLSPHKCERIYQHVHPPPCYWGLRYTTREKKTKKATFASACAAEVQPGAERASVKCAVI